ncbi:hypothetical protein GCM10009802_10130 [Streptomyces synnematoformans]|uniref:FAD/NAD(P)-binding domain-containing protein n=1 Tax=Streptomyces synnematoformans TaxID=415721 RepID=A0ABN2XKH9_9ACTN
MAAGPGRGDRTGLLVRRRLPGPGLAIVEAIVHAHHGNVHVESDPMPRTGVPGLYAAGDARRP